MSEDIASRDYEAEIYLLKAEIKRLEAEVERLKCCGNCGNYTYDMEEDHYYCNRHIFNGRLHAGVCSNHWETDGLTAEKRK